MPVRIIFRGLILFEIPEPNETGKIVAHLINKEKIPNRLDHMEDHGPHKAPHGPHEHNHVGRIQVAAGDGKADQPIPAGLLYKENITINVPGGEAGRVAQSFYDHVPRLSDVMGNPSIDAVRAAAHANASPRLNRELVRNTITINQGTLRVRNAVTWDHGAFPLSGRRGQGGAGDDRGRQAASHAALKFVGSNWQGHAASEFVVDVWEAHSVEVRTDKDKGFEKNAKATGRVSHRVPYGTVEVLITNYEVQEHIAVPWGLDFQWLFEAMGYPAADLADDFAAVERLGTTFDSEVFEHDRYLLLERNRDDRLTLGRPFPYVVSPQGVERLVRLNPNSVTPLPPLTSTDEEDRPICIGGRK